MKQILRCNDQGIRTCVLDTIKCSGYLCWQLLLHMASNFCEHILQVESWWICYSEKSQVCRIYFKKSILSLPHPQMKYCILQWVSDWNTSYFNVALWTPARNTECTVIDSETLGSMMRVVTHFIGFNLTLVLRNQK